MSDFKNKQNVSQLSKIKWERDLIKRLNKFFGSKEAHRGKNVGNMQSPDIDAPFFWIKTGYGKSITLEKTLNSAIDNGCGNLNRKILAIYKKSPAAPTQVAMEFDEFIKLLSEMGIWK